jgi:hypothetical protein
MKSLTLAVFALFATFGAQADGIPQAPKTPYWYSCRAALNNSPANLYVDEDGPQLWITYYGGNIGMPVSNDIYEALKTRSLANLVGKSFTARPGPSGNPYYVRSVSFSAGTQGINLRMQELKGTKFVADLINCVPARNPARP